MKQFNVLLIAATCIIPGVAFAALEGGTGANPTAYGQSSYYTQGGYGFDNVGSMPSWNDVSNFSNDYNQGTYYGQGSYSLSGDSSGSSYTSSYGEGGGASSLSDSGGSSSDSGGNWFSSVIDAVRTNAIAAAKAIASSPQAVVKYGSDVINVARERLGLGSVSQQDYANLPTRGLPQPDGNGDTSQASGNSEQDAEPQLLNEEIPDFVYEQFAHDEAVRRAAVGDTSRDGLSAAEREALDRACLSGLECESPAVREAVRISLKANGNNAQKAVSAIVDIGIETGEHPNTVLKRMALFGDTDTTSSSCSSECEATKRLHGLGIDQSRILEEIEASSKKENELRESKGLPPLAVSCLDGGTACLSKPGVVQIAGGDAETQAEAAQTAERTRLFGSGGVANYTTEELYEIYGGKQGTSISAEQAFSEIRRRTGLSDWLQTFSDEYLSKVAKGEEVAFQFMEQGRARQELARRENAQSITRGVGFDPTTPAIPQVVVTVPNEGSFSLFDPTPLAQQVPTIRAATVDMRALPQIGYKTFEGIQETTVPARSVKTLDIYDTSQITYKSSLGAFVATNSYTDPIAGDLGNSTFVRGSEDLKVILPVGQKIYETLNGIPIMSPGELLLAGKLNLSQGGRYDSETEKAAIELALRGELDDETRIAIASGNASPKQYAEAAAIIMTLYNRAIAEGTSVYAQVYKPKAISSVTVDKRAFDISAPGLLDQVAQLTDGSKAQELGLTNIAPDGAAYATHYYSPSGIQSQTDQERSTPAQWNIDLTMPYYPSPDGHIFGNVLFKDGSGTEFPIAGIQLPVSPVVPASTILPDRSILIAQAQHNGIPLFDDPNIRLASAENGELTVPPTVTIPGLPDNPNPQVAAKTPLSGETVGQVFADAGVEVVESQPGATQLNGMRAGTVAEVLDLEQRLPGEIVITGGTEVGYHDETIEYSHSLGYKVDIRLNDATRAYVESLDPAGTRGDGAKLYTDPAKPNVVYAIENNHIDITVKAEDTDVLPQQESDTIVGGFETAHPDLATPPLSDTPPTEERPSFFKRTGDAIVRVFESLVGGGDTSSPNDFTSLPEQPKGRTLAIGDIKELKVYFGLDILCPQIQGIPNNPYLYTVSFYKKETVVKRTGCGEGGTDTFAQAIARDLQETQGFGSLDPHRLLDKMQIVFYDIDEVNAQ